MDVSSLTPASANSSGLRNSGGAADFSSSSTNVSSTASSIATSVSVQGVPSSDRVAQAVDQVNAIFAQKGQNLHGSVDKDKVSGVFVYKIVDTETQEIVRQLPPKEVVAFAQSLEQPQGWRGLLIQATS